MTNRNAVCVAENATTLLSTRSWARAAAITSTSRSVAALPLRDTTQMAPAGTIRSRSRTGKFCRQLRSDWTDAWEQEGAPRPLPMPLQSMVSDTAMSKVLKLANGGHAGAKELASYFVGQGVGLMNVSQSTRQVVMEFMSDYLLAVERLQGTLEE